MCKLQFALDSQTKLPKSAISVGAIHDSGSDQHALADPMLGGRSCICNNQLALSMQGAINPISHAHIAPLQSLQIGSFLLGRAATVGLKQ